MNNHWLRWQRIALPPVLEEPAVIVENTARREVKGMADTTPLKSPPEKGWLLENPKGAEKQFSIPPGA
jgi:hypothetical protein